MKTFADVLQLVRHRSGDDRIPLISKGLYILPRRYSSAVVLSIRHETTTLMTLRFFRQNRYGFKWRFVVKARVGNDVGTTKFFELNDPIDKLTSLRYDLLDIAEELYKFLDL